MPFESVDLACEQVERANHAADERRQSVNSLSVVGGSGGAGDVPLDKGVVEPGVSIRRFAELLVQCGLNGAHARRVALSDAPISN